MKKLLLTLTALVAVAAGWAQDVKVEFITPSIVHIVKGQPTKTLVVTAKPENVAVTQSGRERRARLWQSVKARSPIEVKLSGRIRSVRAQ